MTTSKEKAISTNLLLTCSSNQQIATQHSKSNEAERESDKLRTGLDHIILTSIANRQAAGWASPINTFIAATEVEGLEALGSFHDRCMGEPTSDE